MKNEPDIIKTHYCPKFFGAMIILMFFFLVSCGKPTVNTDSIDTQIEHALKIIDLDTTSISLPKLPYPISTQARMALVDSALSYPPGTIRTGTELKDIELTDIRYKYIAEILKILGIYKAPYQSDTNSHHIEKEEFDKDYPLQVSSEVPFPEAIKSILLGAARASSSQIKHGGRPSPDELQSISPHLNKLLEFDGSTSEEYRLIPENYHTIGQRVELSSIASSLLHLFTSIELVLPDLVMADPVDKTYEWQTPMGLVRIAGPDDDHHEGRFLLLIDTGGNDTYQNVGSGLSPGNVSITIDISGDDRVTWDTVPGPGAGIMGTGIWIDLDGNDHYLGKNMGLGAALYGGGIFWDDNGNDIYHTGALSQGVGHYGVGIFVDRDGDDSHKTSTTGQGFGGPGGVGVLIDYNGNDDYACGGRIPDTAKSRTGRHKEIHYISMCQGFAFGLRDTISGGIGLLIDHSGDDSYKTDIFGQGGGYWFGLGLLLDAAGSDYYEIFEHGQGAGIHLGGGFLGDWGGNDTYLASVHAQGVGVDRAFGILYEVSGDDSYQSSRESQGAGIKPYGVGILVDNMGNDSYKALIESQGYAKPDLRFPASQWPIGILLDLNGTASFTQPYTEQVGSTGRIQNRQGIAISR